MKRIISILLSLCLLVLGLASLSGCGKKTDENDAVLCVGPYPDTVDPALNSDVNGASYIVHIFSGLVGWEKDEQGHLTLTPQCAKALPTAQPTSDGKVSYTYELRDNLKWSDGTPLTAADFVYAWNRAASPTAGSDYGYMFEVIDGYAAMVETDEAGKLKNPTARLNVTASADGRSLTVVLPVDVPYFHELTAFPVYMPVRQDLVEQHGDAWAANPATYIGNGPYRVKEFSRTRMVLEKNPHYFAPERIPTPRLTFAFNGDDVSLLTNYRNGSYLFIDSVPNDEIAALREGDRKEEFFVQGQMGTYCICFNVNDPALAAFTQEERTNIRRALGLLIDRNYICNDLGQAGQVPAAGFVALGLTEPDGTEYVKRNGPNRDGKGYYSVAAADYTANCDEAVKLLTQVAQSSGKFTVTDGKVAGFPSLTYLTDEGTHHEAIAAYLQQIWGAYGIPLRVDIRERASFLNTRKAGDYSVARNGWVGDYNDPISFLDMWITSSGNNDCQLGRGEHRDYAGYGGQTWAATYDSLIAQVKTTADPAQRFEKMHRAEDLLMETAAICPIYYYTDIYMCSPRLQGFFSSPMGIKYFMYASLKE